MIENKTGTTQRLVDENDLILVRVDTKPVGFMDKHILTSPSDLEYTSEFVLRYAH